jgi:hypothetical protein
MGPLDQARSASTGTALFRAKTHEFDVAAELDHNL